MTTQAKHFLALLMVAFLLSDTTIAQQVYVSSGNGINPMQEQVEVTTAGNEMNIARSLLPNRILADYPKIMKHFSASFPDADNQQWSKTNHNLFVSFINNGQKTRACFTENGTMNYAITNCSEGQLPSRLLKFIKTNYSGYTLFNAIEINAYNAIAHQLILENKDNYITLKSTSDGVEEICHVNKS